MTLGTRRRDLCYRKTPTSPSLETVPRRQRYGPESARMHFIGVRGTGVFADTSTAGGSIWSRAKS